MPMPVFVFFLVTLILVILDLLTNLRVIKNLRTSIKRTEKLIQLLGEARNV